jgi:tape measure domain-containing protein
MAVFGTATAAALSNLQSYAEFDGLVRGLKTIEGTAAGTQARLELLRDVAKLPGLGFEEAVRGDIRLRAVGLSAKQSESILRSFGNAIATVGGGKAELDGVILALGQIQSKGKISTEEINQLAERVPQVRDAIKDAIGTSDIEALGKSTLTTTQFIDGLTESLGKLPKVTGGAQNTLDNYNDSWKELTNSANEFAVGISSTWIDSVSGAFNQATRDLKALKDFFGVPTPGLGGEDGAGADIQAFRKKREEKAALAKAAADAQRAADLANEAFAKRLADERADYEKEVLEKRVEAEAEASKRIRRLREEGFAATLDPEADLRRRISEKKAEGPSDRKALEGTQDLLVKEQIFQRGTEILKLEKQLAELQAQRTAKAAAEAESAESKAESAAKESKARSTAKAAFELEGKILDAKAAKNTKLVESLERQAKVESLKLELMEKQGLAEKEAASAAEKRIALEERAANPKRRGVLDAAASAAARAGRRSAADVARDERRGGAGNNTDRLALADLERRRNRPLSPAAAAEQLARGKGAADPGKTRREERAEAKQKASDPLLAAVRGIEELLETSATA